MQRWGELRGSVCTKGKWLQNNCQMQCHCDSRSCPAHTHVLAYCWLQTLALCEPLQMGNSRLKAV